MVRKFSEGFDSTAVAVTNKLLAEKKKTMDSIIGDLKVQYSNELIPSSQYETLLKQALDINDIISYAKAATPSPLAKFAPSATKFDINKTIQIVDVYNAVRNFSTHYENNFASDPWRRVYVEKYVNLSEDNPATMFSDIAKGIKESMALLSNERYSLDKCQSFKNKLTDISDKIEEGKQKYYADASMYIKASADYENSVSNLNKELFSISQAVKNLKVLGGLDGIWDLNLSDLTDVCDFFDHRSAIDGFAFVDSEMKDIILFYEAKYEKNQYPADLYASLKEKSMEINSRLISLQGELEGSYGKFVNASNIFHQQIEEGRQSGLTLQGELVVIQEELKISSISGTVLGTDPIRGFADSLKELGFIDNLEADNIADTIHTGLEFTGDILKLISMPWNKEHVKAAKEKRRKRK